ncbi:hypothetical protein Bbelb_072400 [Branchiostoma belcheri]|nr:hypothetical protein Bbelb_072400 [Branchiostoma belcheri]
MGGCPAIRPKCRRSSQTGDTSERARLGVRASATALRRRGKDRRGPTWSTGLNDGLAPAGKRWEGARRLGLSVGGHLRPGTHRRGPDLEYGPQRRPCAGGEKMGGCPAIRPKCRRSSLTGDTSERARLEVRASATALRRRGKDGRTGDTSERARLGVRASATALRRRGKDRRVKQRRGNIGGYPAIQASCRRSSQTGDTSERARTWSTGSHRRPSAGGKHRRVPAIRPKCRRPSLTGDTSERARPEVRASATALRRRGKDGRGPTCSPGLSDGLAPAGKRWEGARRLGLSVGGHLRPGTHRRGPDLEYGPQRRPCAGGEKMGGCPAIRPKCRRSSLTGDTSERARLEVRASATALRRRGKDGRVPGD